MASLMLEWLMLQISSAVSCSPIFCMSRSLSRSRCIRSHIPSSANALSFRDTTSINTMIFFITNQINMLNICSLCFRRGPGSSCAGQSYGYPINHAIALSPIGAIKCSPDERGLAVQYDLYRYLLQQFYHVRVPEKLLTEQRLPQQRINPWGDAPSKQDAARGLMFKCQARSFPPHITHEPVHRLDTGSI